MSGDLSLSAALGGLRIANPDDNDTPPAASQIDNASYEPDLNVISAPSIPQTTVHLQANPAARDIYDSPPSHNQLHRVRDSSPSSIHRSQQSRYRSSSDPRTTIPNSSQISRNPSTRTRNIDTAIPVSRPPYVREGSTTSYNPNHLNYDPSYNRASASVPGQAGRPYSVSYAPTHVHDPRSGQSSQLSRAASQRGPHPHSMAGPQMAMDNQPPPRRSSRGVSQQGGAPSEGFGPGSSVPRTEQEWKDRGAVVGMKREIDADGRPVMRPFKKGVSDFNFGQVLGEGSYSTVYYATDRQTLKDYAVKVLDKRHIIKEKKIKYVTIEKDTLNRLTEHPGVVRLYYTFQDQASLYFVLDLCNGGELLGALKKTGTFDVDCTRFYGAELLDAIDYMHARGVIHRDLKPENVLLDDNMHIKITDFGTAKLLPDPKLARSSTGQETRSSDSQSKDGRTVSFVGTAEYVSPELLMNKKVGKPSDIWAFGCIIYQLLAGRPPFKGNTEYLTFQKILALEYEFPHGFPHHARDLVERCLVIDPAHRVTIEHIKNHEFFQGQFFGKQLWKGPAPRLRAYVPPPQEPNIIQLGNSNAKSPGLPSSGSSKPQSRGRPQSNSGINPSPRAATQITELPPPSQIDIDWSPILTRPSERVLKMGEHVVVSSPSSGSPKGDEGHKKLSRFFGGSNIKKKQRLVIVTTAGRILLAPSGGSDKKVKQEISLLAEDCVWRTQQDSKGMIHWSLDTGGVHYTFEEPKYPSPDNKLANDWIDTLERSKDIGSSQAALSGENYDLPDNRPSSPASTTGGLSTYDGYGPGMSGSRNPINKANTGEEFTAKRNRFSKRQSKSGLGPVF